MNQTSMREQLELQSNRIEALLYTHRVEARVTGGTVTPRWIRFQILPAMGTKISKIYGLGEEMSAALNVPNCRVSRRGAAVDVEIPRDDPVPVQFLPLYKQIVDSGGRIPPATAVLGLSNDGAPILIRLPSPDVAHVLVAGTTGSGKTVLMQTMILSLALANPAPSPFSVGSAGLRLVLIDPKGYAFAPFAALPHLAREIVTDPRDAAEALGSLAYLMERTAAPSGQLTCSRVVVFIDELADLLMTSNDAIQFALTRLTQRGREAGIHIVAATQKPTAEILGSLIKANFPVRLVGRVTCASDARTATGWSGTGAERLMGRGDFLAVAEGRVTRFQTSHITPDEIIAVINDMAHQNTKSEVSRCESKKTR